MKIAFEDNFLGLSQKKIEEKRDGECVVCWWRGRKERTTGFIPQRRFLLVLRLLQVLRLRLRLRLRLVGQPLQLDVAPQAGIKRCLKLS